eukprot:TRINITY_DN5149_c0_g1_i2.p1 TRINITY_DN5149_c0_g1~~TRINITY_DN5149_c0_g1_i2.p1  ORF type:complete len:473 (-),score=106.69 TRINITY_DN5149_c0_g1_i2:19-1437(-)
MSFLGIRDTLTPIESENESEKSNATPHTAIDQRTNSSLLGRRGVKGSIARISLHTHTDEPCDSNDGDTYTHTHLHTANLSTHHEAAMSVSIAATLLSPRPMLYPRSASIDAGLIDSSSSTTATPSSTTTTSSSHYTDTHVRQYQHQYSVDLIDHLGFDPTAQIRSGVVADLDVGLDQDLDTDQDANTDESHQTTRVKHSGRKQDSALRKLMGNESDSDKDLDSTSASNSDEESDAPLQERIVKDRSPSYNRAVSYTDTTANPANHHEENPSLQQAPDLSSNLTTSFASLSTSLTTSSMMGESSTSVVTMSTSQIDADLGVDGDVIVVANVTPTVQHTKLVKMSKEPPVVEYDLFADFIRLETNSISLPLHPKIKKKFQKHRQTKEKKETKKSKQHLKSILKQMQKSKAVQLDVCDAEICHLVYQLFECTHLIDISMNNNLVSIDGDSRVDMHIPIPIPLAHIRFHVVSKPFA